MSPNPYGAVPAALSETRLTLRDIMADMLATKAAEGRLKLETAKAQTETAMVAAGLEKERLTDIRETAKLKMAAEQHAAETAQTATRFEKDYGLRERGQTLQAEQVAGQQEIAREQIDVSRGHLKVAESAELRAAAEKKRDNEIRTIGDWAAAGGIQPGLLEFTGIDPAKKITRADAKELYANLQVQFKANPSMGLMAHGYGLKNELVSLGEQLRQPGLAPEQAAALKKTYDRKLAQFENLDKLIMAEKAPDQAKIVSAAKSAWAENPELATQYGTYDKFLSAFQKEVTQARGVFQDDIQALKNPVETTPAEQKAALDGIRALVKEIQAGKYRLSPQELKIVQRMTAAVQPEKAGDTLRSLKNILGAAPLKQEPAAAAADRGATLPAASLYWQ